MTTADPSSDHAISSTPWSRPGRTLLVASSGGHLDELYRLWCRLASTLDEVEWATFDTNQAHELLAGHRVHFVPRVHPKDLTGTALNTREARRLLRTGRFVRVISTGAAVALPYLSIARSYGLATHYIESAARSQGPSLTGRLVARVPKVRLYGQYPAWSAGRWQYRGSVFDGYAARPKGRRTHPGVTKVVVTFGTQARFGFRRAAEKLVAILPRVCAPDATILWQTGATNMHGLAVDSTETVPLGDLVAAIREADLVIGHAGVGSALLSLENGKCPVLLPRSSADREHTDDHQHFVAAELSRRRLAVRADVEQINEEQLLGAVNNGTTSVSSPPEFLLQPD